MANDSVVCLTCTKLVPEDSQAIQCDLCHKWAHIGCVGVTKVAYKLAVERIQSLVSMYMMMCVNYLLLE